MGQSVTESCAATTPAEENAETVRHRIYQAAEAEFRQNGFHATTMDTVARAACCSKKTIYKLFASKEELFLQLIDRFKSAIKRMEVDPTLPPEAALEDLLFRIGTIILREDSITTLRMVLSEYASNPSLLQAAERQFGGGVDALDSYFTVLEQRYGHDFGPDKQEAARMLVGMALGAFHYERLVGRLPALSEPELRKRIRHAVTIFLAGTRAVPG